MKTSLKTELLLLMAVLVSYCVPLSAAIELPSADQIATLKRLAKAAWINPKVVPDVMANNSDWSKLIRRMYAISVRQSELFYMTQSMEDYMTQSMEEDEIILVVLGHGLNLLDFYSLRSVEDMVKKSLEKDDIDFSFLAFLLDKTPSIIKRKKYLYRYKILIKAMKLFSGVQRKSSWPEERANLWDGDNSIVNVNVNDLADFIESNREVVNVTSALPTTKQFLRVQVK